MMFLTPKSWKVLGAFLVTAGMSLGTAGSVQAGDCCYDSCCEPTCVFTSAGDSLCSRISSLCGCFEDDDYCCDDLCCDDYCCDDGCCGAAAAESPWSFGGWVQTGMHTANNSLFNSHQDRFNAHQLWTYVERSADGSDGWDVGGRVDVMWGVDGPDTQAFGNSDSRWDFDAGRNVSNGYAWAIPQAYLEVANGDWSVIAGHFYTLLGYEVVTAPDNFFYSHAFTMYNSEAFTHTGVLASHAASDSVTNYYGWTLGWDTGFDQNAGGSSFLGGSSIALSDSTSVTFISTAGDFGANGTGYSHSVVLDHTFGEDDQFNYIFQSDYMDATAYNPYMIAASKAEAVGINQYLIYTVSDTLGLGTRFEWWRLDSQDTYSWTLGANVRPTDNLVIRPEIRHYFGDGTAAAAINTAAGDKTFDSFILGVDAILTF